jgi:hypothetical protein
MATAPAPAPSAQLPSPAGRASRPSSTHWRSLAANSRSSCGVSHTQRMTSTLTREPPSAPRTVRSRFVRGS